MNLKLIMISLLACGFAMSANAGVITDSDSDLIPNVFDNCPTIANMDQADADFDAVGDVCDNCSAVSGTPEGTQLDTDADGYGNCCDFDYTTTLCPGNPGCADGATSPGDAAAFLAQFPSSVKGPPNSYH